jgi:hypothetical protein
MIRPLYIVICQARSAAEEDRQNQSYRFNSVIADDPRAYYAAECGKRVYPE